MFKKYLSILAFSTLAMPLHANDAQKEADLMQTGIKHVVVVMLENRSFDNVLAWLYTNDAPNYFIPQNTNPHYEGLTEGILSKYTNTLKDASGNVIFSTPPIKGVPSVSSSPYLNSPCTDPNEEFQYVTNQIFGFDGSTEPTMTGFLQDYGNLWSTNVWTFEQPQICAIMETYTEKDIPILHGLAKHYAVSDFWFSSVPTQTNPNRAFSICGTSEGQTINGSLGKSLFTSDTLWNRLSEESPDTSWMIFWHSNMLPGIIEGPFTGPDNFSAFNRIPHYEDHYLKMDAFHRLARKGRLPAFSFIEPLWTLSENLAPNNFLIKIFSSYQNTVEGLQGNDMHPPGDVRPTENFLANIYTSLIANPDAWKDTLLVVLFDEHGGLFDHVPPPTAISPDQHFQEGFKFDRYGVRVPAIFISPKINKGTVIRSEDPAIPFDHTSLIATVLKWKNVDKAKWNMGKRVEAAPTFEAVITRTDNRDDYVLKPDSISLPPVDPRNVVQMGDKFYLRNKDGDYLSHAHLFFKVDARLGPSEERVVLSFVGGSGTLSHGSFALIQSHDSAFGNFNILGTSIEHSDCIYAANTHDPAQWWTIKSLESPYVGAEIQYGDRVYIENHTYLDPSQYLPTRLAIDYSIFGTFLRTKDITRKGSDESYWFLEKVEDNVLNDYTPPVLTLAAP